MFAGSSEEFGNILEISVINFLLAHDSLRQVDAIPFDVENTADARTAILELAANKAVAVDSKQFDGFASGYILWRQRTPMGGMKESGATTLVQIRFSIGERKKAEHLIA
jgi:hypothetical protein